ncbi:hypothetical protein I4F81_012568 [Pyropia yezoensis]|uniref:Uncharacterized protein n=1 Tax=Pyropia yezoensis TaxID=2788 RepID=A0ACC3CIK0_PYRYE|nr:hypothetical protein I4F81_012568 [Neopyropia yezoensis]
MIGRIPSCLPQLPSTPSYLPSRKPRSPRRHLSSSPAHPPSRTLFATARPVLSWGLSQWLSLWRRWAPPMHVRRALEEGGCREGVGGVRRRRRVCVERTLEKLLVRLLPVGRRLMQAGVLLLPGGALLSACGRLPPVAGRGGGCDRGGGTAATGGEAAATGGGSAAAGGRGAAGVRPAGREAFAGGEAGWLLLPGWGSGCYRRGWPATAAWGRAVTRGGCGCLDGAAPAYEAGGRLLPAGGGGGCYASWGGLLLLGVRLLPRERSC